MAHKGSEGKRGNGCANETDIQKSTFFQSVHSVATVQTPWCNPWAVSQIYQFQNKHSIDNILQKYWCDLLWVFIYDNCLIGPNQKKKYLTLTAVKCVSWPHQQTTCSVCHSTPLGGSNQSLTCRSGVYACVCMCVTWPTSPWLAHTAVLLHLIICSIERQLRSSELRGLDHVISSLSSQVSVFVSVSACVATSALTTATTLPGHADSLVTKSSLSVCTCCCAGVTLATVVMRNSLHGYTEKFLKVHIVLGHHTTSEEWAHSTLRNSRCRSS